MTDKELIKTLTEEKNELIEETLKLSELWLKSQEEKRQLEANIAEAIEHIQKGIDNEEYNCSCERSWIEIKEDEENYFIDDYFTKSIEILKRGRE